MTAAALVCGSCGAELPPNSKFCNECGAAVAIATTLAEYKQVTVLMRCVRTYSWVRRVNARVPADW
jgi:predicted amidophosphoribosyltransferase